MVLREWARDAVAETADVRAALRRAATDPASLTDGEWVALLGADGTELDELCAIADSARQTVTDPDALTFVVNRNFDTTVIASGADGVPELSALVDEAWQLGATEICMQGPIPVDAPDDGYLRLIEQIHAVAPEMHLRT